MTSEIIFEEKNKLGVIILNRPKALNALNDKMFLQLQHHLEKWKTDRAIKAVLIKSNCEKAFCAGGDIRAIFENKHKTPDEIAHYFEIEYHINQLIAEFPKPYVALLHGITMGGGVGVSIHGSHTVAADDLRWAMPESIIGFFPDVGATYYLSRMPHHIGMYLALTGNSINAKEALALNVIQAIASKNQFSHIEKKLSEADFDDDDLEVVTKIIQSESHLHAKNTFDHASDIEHCFRFSTVEAIMHALKERNSDWSLETLKQLQQRSPTSLKVALKQMQLAKEKSVIDVIKMDLQIARVMLKHHDFFEGVRAAIIDKDKNPKWKPEKISDVTDKMISAYF